MTEPRGFDWDDLAGVETETLEAIDDTVQELIDSILVRQQMLEEICDN